VLQHYYRTGVGQHVDVAVAERAVAQQALRERGLHLLRSFPPHMGLAVGMVADQSCFPMKGGVPTNAALAPGVDEDQALADQPQHASFRSNAGTSWMRAALKAWPSLHGSGGRFLQSASVQALIAKSA
jgi:hypothetical protein